MLFTERHWRRDSFIYTCTCYSAWSRAWTWACLLRLVQSSILYYVYATLPPPHYQIRSCEHKYIQLRAFIFRFRRLEKAPYTFDSTEQSPCVLRACSHQTTTVLLIHAILHMIVVLFSNRFPWNKKNAETAAPYLLLRPTDDSDEKDPCWKRRGDRGNRGLDLQYPKRRSFLAKRNSSEPAQAEA